MTTFVLVPGAGGQAGCWHRLVAELERRPPSGSVWESTRYRAATWWR
jgi:hypothetical protein